MAGLTGGAIPRGGGGLGNAEAGEMVGLAAVIAKRDLALGRAMLADITIRVFQEVVARLDGDRVGLVFTDLVPVSIGELGQCGGRDPDPRLV